jgi:hypothetical protein
MYLHSPLRRSQPECEHSTNETQHGRKCDLKRPQELVSVWSSVPGSRRLPTTRSTSTCVSKNRHTLHKPTHTHARTRTQQSTSPSIRFALGKVNLRWKHTRPFRHLPCNRHLRVGNAHQMPTKCPPNTHQMLTSVGTWSKRKKSGTMPATRARTTHAHINTHAHTHAYTHTHAYRRTHNTHTIHTHTHRHTHTHTHTTHTHTHTHTN